MRHQYILFLAHHLRPLEQHQRMMLLKFEHLKNSKMLESLHQLANSHCSAQLQCLEFLTRKFFFTLFFGTLFLAMDNLVDLLSRQINPACHYNEWWRSRNFNHSQALQIIFPFAPSTTFLITNIGVNNLHTFCDAKNWSSPLVTTFLLTTPKSIQRHTEAMISHRFLSRS